MKKTLLTTAVVAVSAASVLAQGTVAFRNGGSSLITNAGVRAVVGTLKVGLYGGAQGASSNSLQLLGPVVLDLSSPGRFNYSVGDGTVTNTFISAGAVGTFQVRVWSGNFASYEAAYAAALSDGTIRLGASSLFDVDTANPSAVPSELAPALDGNGLTPITTTVLTPEPGTIALGVLGVGSLLALRRRKS